MSGDLSLSSSGRTGRSVQAAAYKVTVIAPRLVRSMPLAAFVGASAVHVGELVFANPRTARQSSTAIWPAEVVRINSAAEAQLHFFGDNTRSLLPCSRLYPFHANRDDAVVQRRMLDVQLFARAMEEADAHAAVSAPRCPSRPTRMHHDAVPVVRDTMAGAAPSEALTQRAFSRGGGTSTAGLVLTFQNGLHSHDLVFANLGSARSSSPAIWPALVLTLDDAGMDADARAAEGDIPVEFFGDGKRAVLPMTRLMPFTENRSHRVVLKRIGSIPLFETAVREADRELVASSMAQMQGTWSIDGEIIERTLIPSRHPKPPGLVPSPPAKKHARPRSWRRAYPSNYASEDADCFATADVSALLDDSVYLARHAKYEAIEKDGFGLLAMPSHSAHAAHHQAQCQPSPHASRPAPANVGPQQSMTVRGRTALGQSQQQQQLA